MRVRVAHCERLRILSVCAFWAFAHFERLRILSVCAFWASSCAFWASSCAFWAFSHFYASQIKSQECAFPRIFALCKALFCEWRKRKAQKCATSKRRNAQNNFHLRISALWDALWTRFFRFLKAQKSANAQIKSQECGNAQTALKKRGMS